MELTFHLDSNIATVYTKARVLDPVVCQQLCITLRVIGLVSDKYLCSVKIDTNLRMYLHKCIQRQILSTFGVAYSLCMPMVCKPWSGIYLYISTGAPFKVGNSDSSALYHYDNKLEVEDIINAICTVKIDDIYVLYDISNGKIIEDSLRYYYDTISIVPSTSEYAFVIIP